MRKDKKRDGVGGGQYVSAIVADLPVVDVTHWSAEELSMHFELIRGLDASGIESNLAGALAARELRVRTEAAAAEVNRRRAAKAPRTRARRNREQLRTELLEKLLPKLARGAQGYAELHRRVQAVWLEKWPALQGFGMGADKRPGVSLRKVTAAAKRLELDLASD